MRNVIVRIELLDETNEIMVLEYSEEKDRIFKYPRDEYITEVDPKNGIWTVKCREDGKIHYASPIGVTIFHREQNPSG